MNWLKKLDKSKRQSAGWEWWLWRKLPWFTVIGLIAPVAVVGLLELLHAGDTREATQRMLQLAWFTCWGVLLFHITTVLTVAIGCIIVMIMKGPGYVADGYWVSHSDRPREEMQSEEESNKRWHVP